MTEAALISLAQIVLPSEVLSSFDITKVESTDTEINIHLDEKMYDTLRNDVHFESKGFIPAVSITDFPIRDHKVILCSDAVNGLIFVPARVLFYLLK